MPMTTSEWKTVWPTQRLKFPVAGLTAENRGTTLRFTFERAEEITEADAIDAQCRAGWDDRGYGCWGFVVERTETGYVANWACSNYCG